MNLCHKRKFRPAAAEAAMIFLHLRHDYPSKFRARSRALTKIGVAIQGRTSSSACEHVKAKELVQKNWLGVVGMVDRNELVKSLSVLRECRVRFDGFG